MISLLTNRIAPNLHVISLQTNRMALAARAVTSVRGFATSVARKVDLFTVRTASVVYPDPELFSGSVE